MPSTNDAHPLIDRTIVWQELRLVRMEWYVIFHHQRCLYHRPPPPAIDEMEENCPTVRNFHEHPGRREMPTQIARVPNHSHGPTINIFFFSPLPYPAASLYHSWYCRYHSVSFGPVVCVQCILDMWTGMLGIQECTQHHTRFCVVCHGIVFDVGDIPYKRKTAPWLVH